MTQGKRMAKKIFFYTKGAEGNPSQELRDMLSLASGGRRILNYTRWI